MAPALQLTHAANIATTYREWEASSALKISPEQIYPFTIGALSCVALGDARHGETRGRGGRCCLLVRDGHRVALIDAGGGPFAHPPGWLLSALGSVGVAPEDVKSVVLTHAHLGHCGGTALATGEAAFPRARILLARAEWEFWTSEPDLRSRGLQHLVAPIRQRLLALSSQIELVGHAAPVAPGIRALATPGHTPGHMAVSIESDGERLLVFGDVLQSAAQALHPKHPAPGDLLPEQALASRLRLLDRATESGVLAHAYHLPFPALGYVRPAGDSWRWEPLTT